PPARAASRTWRISGAWPSATFICAVVACSTRGSASKTISTAAASPASSAASRSTPAARTTEGRRCTEAALQFFPGNQNHAENHQQHRANLARGQPLDVMEKQRRERQDEERRAVDQRRDDRHPLHAERGEGERVGEKIHEAGGGEKLQAARRGGGARLFFFSGEIQERHGDERSGGGDGRAQDRRMNLDNADAHQIVARGEQEGGGERKQEIARAPGLGRAAPGKRDDAGDDRKRARQIGCAGPLAEKTYREHRGEERRAVGKAGRDRSAEPFHAFENEIARPAWNKDSNRDEQQIHGLPEVRSMDEE